MLPDEALGCPDFEFSVPRLPYLRHSPGKTESKAVWDLNETASPDRRHAIWKSDTLDSAKEDVLEWCDHLDDRMKKMMLRISMEEFLENSWENGENPLKVESKKDVL